MDQYGQGSTSKIAQAIIYAVDQGADIINMSLTSSFDNPLLRAAVTYAHQQGVVTVAAIGNQGLELLKYPAAYTESIAVGYTDHQDLRVLTSNFGTHIDVVAPGRYIYSLDHDSDETYDDMRSGSSMATPQVSGLASLLLAQNPELKPDQIREIIRSTAEDQIGNPFEDTSGWDPYYGYGRINAHQALSLNNVPIIESFTLIDADTNEEIQELSDGDILDINQLFEKNLSIQVNTIPKQIGSVNIIMHGPISTEKVENFSPYSLFGDNQINGYVGKGFPPGIYQITARPYGESRLSGVEGQSKTITFSIKGNPEVTSLVLVDVTNNEDILEIQEDMVLDLSTLESGISIRAEVRFAKGAIFTLKDMNNITIHEQIEKIEPYALFGDDLKGNYHPWIPPQGAYTLTVEPFINSNIIGGSSGINTKTLNFEVINPEPIDLPGQLSIYPNESTDWINLSVPQNSDQSSSIEIFKYPQIKVYEQSFRGDIFLKPQPGSIW